MRQGRDWLGRIGTAVVGTVRRFPLVILMGAAGALAGCLLKDAHWAPLPPDTVITILLSCWMGLGLFLIAALIGERTRPAVAWALNAAAAALVVASFACLHKQCDEWVAPRIALWMLAVHGALATVPLWGRDGRVTFRPFNTLLFSRTLVALLLTHVLFAGLSFALLACQKLFDLRVPDATYGRLWFLLMGIFNTFYVLAGIPREPDQVPGQFRSPPVLDLLARHILMPLSALYLLILYVYSAKIIIVHEWPRGWVSAPIIAFALVGLLTVVLLGPDRAESGRWVRAYCRGFFVTLLPLVALLFMGIGRRATEYGLTEQRCLVFAVAFYLAIIAPYFVLSRTRNLTVIPLALVLVALVASVGPLSVTSVSLRSQVSRLRTLLAENGRLKGDVVVVDGAPMSSRAENEISGVLVYLHKRRQLATVTDWLAPGARNPEQVAARLAMAYRPWGAYVDEGRERTIALAAQPTSATAIGGFDWMVPIGFCEQAHDCRGSGRGGPPDLRVRLLGASLLVAFKDGSEQTISLAPLVARFSREDSRSDDVAPADLTLEGVLPSRAGYRLILGRITLIRSAAKKEQLDVQDLSGTLLLRDAPPAVSP